MSGYQRIQPRAQGAARPTPQRAQRQNGYISVGNARNGTSTKSGPSSIMSRGKEAMQTTRWGGHEYGPITPLTKRGYGDGASSIKTGSHSGSSGERLLQSDAYSLAGADWQVTRVGTVSHSGKAEADDDLHDPRNADRHSHRISWGGALNICTLLTLILGLLMLFAGYPIASHFLTSSEGNKGAYGLGGTNGTGQVAALSATRAMIDPDTPSSAKTYTSSISKNTYQLQFSDEFETEGRTFWPGDDPFWEAVNIWYGATGDYEWYSPENINTTGGALVITMTDVASHNLNFQSGMLQSWNKLCFQGGYVEFAIILPGSQSTKGYWPGAWSMGNLARAGYLSTSDGMWPYSYQGCDTGIMANQTNAQGGPVQAVDSTAPFASKGRLSKLPGMRTPSCTCSGQDHPGPNVNVGRSAPEIDALEAQVQYHQGNLVTFASQSYQIAPFDEDYFYTNTTPATTIIGDETHFNSYVGGPYQEALSALSVVPERGFMNYDAPDAQKYVTYAFEWLPDWDLNGGGSITWFVDGKPTWQATGAAIPASAIMEISQRNIPVEPMSVIMNLGMSAGFQDIDFDPTTGVSFPAQMKFDYVRIYQQKGQVRMSCDPSDYPTADYIQNHPEPYNNPNLTQWKDTTYAWPTNKQVTGC